MPLPTPALVTDVTVPDAPELFIVTSPVAELIVTFVPATMLVTPVLLTVTAPVPAETPMPVPATADVTPVFENVTSPVAAETPIPVPATADVTPVFAITGVAADDTLIPAPAAKSAAIVMDLSIFAVKFMPLPSARFAEISTL
jgi:hypothetical protein